MHKKIVNKKVGIFFSPEKKLGGGYQYTVSILNALLNIKNVDIYIFNISSDLPKIKRNKNVHILNLVKTNGKIISLRDNLSYLVTKHMSWIVKVAYKLGLFNVLYIFLKLVNRNTIKLIDSKKLDLMFFPIPIYLSSMIKTQTVVSILDLEHLFKGKFKEATAGGRWEYREFGYRKIVQKAWRIFVDSEKSKKDLNDYYGASQSIVLKYISPSDLKENLSAYDIKKMNSKFNLKNKYVFYPAKFWPHKNQINLIKAVEILRKNNIPIDLVLTGSPNADFSTFDFIQKYIKDNKLKNIVKYFGYVTYNELSFLYQNALCMAMPTFFGPTNIPVYEAWRMKTPVIYSNIDGCREQLGDAGILINPNRPEEIAKAIEKLYKDNKLRLTLISRGTERLSEWTEKDFRDKISQIIEEYGNNRDS